MHHVFMQRALELARFAQEQGEVPVGAVIIQNNEIIAEGYNQPISSCDPTAHAEIVALRNAAKKINNYRLNDLTMVVTLEPCTMCAGALIHARIKRLVFGAMDAKMGAVCSAHRLLDHPSMNHSIEWHDGIMAVEAAQLLTSFFGAKRDNA